MRRLVYSDGLVRYSISQRDVDPLLEERRQASPWLRIEEFVRKVMITAVWEKTGERPVKPEEDVMCSVDFSISGLIAEGGFAGLRSEWYEKPESEGEHREEFGGLTLWEWCCGRPMRCIKRFYRDRATGEVWRLQNEHYCKHCNRRRYYMPSL